MRLFRCSCNDRPLLYFENSACGQCGRMIGFAQDRMQLMPFTSALDTQLAGPSLWQNDQGELYRQCANRYPHGACNWMVPQGSSDFLAATSASESGSASAPQTSERCRACALNELVPDLGVDSNIGPWRKMEMAKRRCLFTLLELRLPVGNAQAQLSARGLVPDAGSVPELRFRFLADSDSAEHFQRPLPGEEPVLTGHVNGLITINLAEADDIARTRMRVSMEERYRTLLGHFRHETGHYYWDILRIANDDFLDVFRADFGDERASYAQALEQHYDQGAGNTDWSTHYVSSYAAAHPWEDWAETWAHYLHIIDTLETQQAFVSTSAAVADEVSDIALPSGLGVNASGLPGAIDFEAMMHLWIDVSIVLNCLNRSMGLPDPYPFVLNSSVQRKLRTVHDAIAAFRRKFL